MRKDSYLLFLDKGNYKIEYDDKEDLKMMIDNLIYLLQIYNVDDDEILDKIIDDTCLEIEKYDNSNF